MECGNRESVLSCAINHDMNQSDHIHNSETWQSRKRKFSDCWDERAEDIESPEKKSRNLAVLKSEISEANSLFPELSTAGPEEDETSSIAEEFRFRRNTTEIEQRKFNEPEFNKLKYVLQNSPLTISEMKELTRLLLKRQHKLEKEILVEDLSTCGEVVKLPNNVLQRIFSFLPTTDIRNCRLVSHDWWHSATKQMRKCTWTRFNSFFRHTTSKFWSQGSNVFGRYDYDLLETCVGVMRHSKLLPVVSFDLTLDYPGPEDEPSIKQFFEIFGAVLENLNFDFQYLSNDFIKTVEWPIQRYLEGICLEKLRRLEFNFSGDNYFQYENESRTLFMSACFAAAPNIEHILLKTDSDSTEFFEALTQQPLVHMNKLTLHSLVLFDSELKSLSRLKLKHFSLKADKIRFKSTTMMEFLSSQSATLEYLKLRAYDVKTKFRYEFPTMENLKVLEIECSQFVRTNNPRRIPEICEHDSNNEDEETEDWRIQDVKDETIKFVPIDWPKCFPKLEEVRIRNGCETHWPESLFSAKSNIHLCLKVLVLPSGFSQYVETWCSEIWRIFPNLETLQLPQLKASLTNLCSHFPRLTTISFPYNSGSINIFTEEEKILKIWKESLKEFAWALDVDDLVLMESNLKTIRQMGFEIEYCSISGSKLETSRKLYDSTWLLRLLRRRLELEKSK